MKINVQYTYRNIFKQKRKMPTLGVASAFFYTGGNLKYIIKLF